MGQWAARRGRASASFLGHGLHIFIASRLVLPLRGVTCKRRCCFTRAARANEDATAGEAAATICGA
eukprot:14913771-Alexandrium_andersonii.AAC.1